MAFSRRHFGRTGRRPEPEAIIAPSLSHVGITPTDHRFDTGTGLLIGLLAGSTVASVTGVGIDMVIYVVLVLLCHADLKIAIPTSVILMASTSVVGIGTKLLLGDIQDGVGGHWLAAAPVVAVGAPLGALIVDKIGRQPTLIFVSVLCLGQFVWMCFHEWPVLGWWGLAAALSGVGLFNLGFMELHALGNRMARRTRTRIAEEPGEDRLDGGASAAVASRVWRVDGDRDLRRSAGVTGGTLSPECRG